MADKSINNIVSRYFVKVLKAGADLESLESEGRDPNSGKRGPENGI